MIYFSERYSKIFFIIAITMILSVFPIMLMGTDYKTEVALMLIAGGLLLYSLGYPFFFFKVRGYYPSGYILPIELIDKLNYKILVEGTTSELSMYAIASDQERLRYLEYDFFDIKTVFTVLPNLSRIARDSRFSSRSRDKAMELFNYWQTELDKYLETLHKESSQDNSFDLVD